MNPLPSKRTALLATAGLLLAATTAHAEGGLLGLPESASAQADQIDGLIYLVTIITGITFVGVQALLIWFLIRYRAKPGVKAKHVHGNHTVELVWTIVPALILVFLALYQAELWLEMKAPTPEKNENPTRVQIFAKQFEWNFRYPGPDGEFGTDDDTRTTGDLVVPVDAPVNAVMRSLDVLHSFYLPNFRTKQDAVPGVTIPIWFLPNKLSADRNPVKNSKGEMVQLEYWDIVCAELCGNQHTTMSGKLWVVPRAEYDKWIAGEDCAVTVSSFPCDITDERGIWFNWAAQDERLPTGSPKWKRGFPFHEDDKGPEEEEDEF